MSYDGGLAIKIVNNVMLGILQKHKDRGTFEGSSLIQDMIGYKSKGSLKYKGMTMAIYWEYLDEADIERCPKNLEQVLDAVIELLDHFAGYDYDDRDRDEAYVYCINELKENRKAINAAYEIVEWAYYHSDYAGGEDETFSFAKKGLEIDWDDSDDEDEYDDDEYDGDEYDDDELYLTDREEDTASEGKPARSVIRMSKDEFDKNYKYFEREEDQYFLGIKVPKGIVIQEYTGTESRVSIPEEVDGVRVVHLGSMGQCPSVAEVIVPESVGCSDDAFAGCPKMFRSDGSLIISGRLLSFHVNSSIIKVPADVKYISPCPFKENKQITEVILPAGLIGIEKCAFEKCENLKTINFPASLKTIGNYAFEGCVSLETVSFPEGLESIGNSAFRGCESLSKVEISPNTVCGERSFSTGNDYLEREDGYTVINGVMYDVDYGVLMSGDDFIVDVPADVTMIAGELIFNSPGLEIDRFTITDKVRSISTSDFFVSSIELFRIIDHRDGHVLFETDWFNNKRDDAGDLLVNSEDFETMCELIEEQDYEKLNELFGNEIASMPPEPEPEAGTALSQADDGAFRKLSDVISVSNDDPNVFLVNNEWTFRLPEGFTYETDCEFDGGLNAGVDLAGDIKPMVIKGIANGDGYLFNFALQEHYDAFGNYYSIVDCKYDNRVADGNPSAMQRIMTDEDDLYVDVMLVESWPFGDDLRIRVRTPEGTPFDFFSMPKSLDDDGAAKVGGAMKEIAASIALEAAGGNAASGSVSQKRKNSPTDQISDPNCIIEGTVLRKYLGSSDNVILPDGITEIADNTFSGRAIRSVTVPEGVKRIGSRVFENCFELEEAVLPTTLEELGDYSFVDCHNLRRVTLGDNITAITGSLFSECYELENVTIPKKAKYIDNFAFKNCRSFTHIVIPDSVESIGFMAFAKCSNLEYLYIPASVTSINDHPLGDTPFEDCPSLTIHCPAGSAAEEYCISHGLSYAADVQRTKASTSGKTRSTAAKSAPASASAVSGKPASPRPAVKASSINWETADEDDCEIDDFDTLESYTGNARSLILPEGITSVGSGCFEFNNDLTDVLIPEGVETIEDNAFRYCSNLKNVILPQSLCEIGDEAFCNCGSLTGIGIPDGCSSIGANCFESSGLTDIVIPDGIDTIEDGTFSYCSRLKSVVLPSSLSDIGDEAFSNCDALTGIDIPDGCGHIGSNCFEFCGSLTDVSLPDSIDSIEESTFSHCKKLKNVVLPQFISELGDNAFSYCDSLTAIVIPDGCSSIGMSCFEYCDNLTDIYVPASVSFIEYDAFNTLNENTVIHTEQGSDAEEFAAENGIKCDYKPAPDPNRPMKPAKAGKVSSSKASGSAPDKDAVAEPVDPAPKPSAPKAAFTGFIEGAKGKRIRVENGIAILDQTDIKNNKRNFGDIFSENDIEEVILEDGIKTLPGNCFSSCHGLKRIRIPGSVKTVGDWAFDHCDSLEEVRLEYGISKIGFGCFESCRSLKRIRIPGSVDAVAINLFKDCTGLEEVILEDGVKNLLSEAFSGCKSLKHLWLPASVTSLWEKYIPKSCICHVIEGSYAHKELKKHELSVIKHMTMPSGIKTIRAGKYGYVFLSTVSCTSSLELIGKGAFENYNHITKVKFNSILQVIDNRAFAIEDKTGRIKELTIPGSVKRIGREAFAGQPIEKLTFDHSRGGIETIEDGAFRDAVLESVDLPATIKELSPNAFGPNTTVRIDGRSISDFFAFKELEKAVKELEKQEEEAARKVDEIKVQKQKEERDAARKVAELRSKLSREEQETAADIRRIRLNLEKNQKAAADTTVEIGRLNSRIEANRFRLINEESLLTQCEQYYELVKRKAAEQQIQNQSRNEQTLAALLSRQTELQQEIERLKTEQSKAFFLNFSRKKQLSAQEASSAEQLAEITREIDAFPQKVKEEAESLEQEIAVARRQYTERSNARNTFTGSIDELNKKKQDRYAELAGLRTEKEELEKQLETAEKQLAGAAEEHAKQIKQLDEQLAAEITSRMEPLLKEAEDQLAAEIIKHAEQLRQIEAQEERLALTGEKERLIGAFGTAPAADFDPARYLPAAADLDLIENDLLNSSFVELLERKNAEATAAAFTAFCEKNRDTFDRIREINDKLGLAKEDGIPVSPAASALDGNAPDSYLPERYRELCSLFGKSRTWKSLKQSVNGIKMKLGGNDLHRTFFAKSDYFMMRDDKTNLLFSPYCIVIFGKDTPMRTYLYGEDQVGVRFHDQDFTDSAPEGSEIVGQRYMYQKRDGTPDIRRRINPIVYTARETYATFAFAPQEGPFEFRMPSQRDAEHFVELYNEHAAELNGDLNGKVYDAVRKSAGLTAIRELDTQSKLAAKEASKREKELQAELERIAEEERAAAEQAAKERRDAIIRRQKELNDERRLDAIINPEASSFYAGADSSKNSDLSGSRSDLDEDVETCSAFALEGQALISNNAFRITLLQEEELPETEAVLYFTDLQGNRISNTKNVSLSGVGTSVVAGFILSSGIDFTEMSASYLHIKGAGFEYLMPFRMNISFYSDF